MGLLDEVGKMMGGGQQGGASDILAVAQQLLGQSGGIDGFIQQLQAGGLGEVVKSWIGNGQNLPVTGEQIQQVLGNDKVAAIARQLGVDPAQASAQLAQVLPGLVDKLTPNGQVPQGGDLLSQGADLLKGFLK